jgi:hypothetical protein
LLVNLRDCEERVELAGHCRLKFPPCRASSGKAAAMEIDRMCKHPIHVENSGFKHA